MYKKRKDRQYLVCVGGMGSILCRKCQSEPHFLTPGKSEVMPGQMPGCSYGTDEDKIIFTLEVSSNNHHRSNHETIFNMLLHFIHCVFNVNNYCFLVFCVRCKVVTIL